MRTNYNEILKQTIRNLDYIPKVLLHSCCAPCSTQVISILSDHFDITVFYYNPNIEPQEEYLKRKDEQINLLKKVKTKNKIDFLDCDYENAEFEKIAKGFENCPEGGKRCYRCYFLRMEKTCKVAKEKKYDYFCTTLSVSPYKNSCILNEIGSDLEKKYNIKYLYSDFKKEDGYKKSIEYSKKFNLYRQNFCGCNYSKNREKI